MTGTCYAVWYDCYVATALWIADIKLHYTGLSMCVDQMFSLSDKRATLKVHLGLYFLQSSRLEQLELVSCLAAKIRSISLVK